MIADKLYALLGEEKARDLITLVFLSLGKEAVIDLIEDLTIDVVLRTVKHSELKSLSQVDLVSTFLVAKDLVELKKKFKEIAGEIYQ